MGLAIAIIYLVIFIVIFQVIIFLMQSPALYRMMKNSGLAAPALAWIPVANNYCLGLLCERGSLCRTGRTMRYSVILPALSVTRILVAILPVMTRLYFLYYFINIIAIVEIVIAAIGVYNLFWDYSRGREDIFTVLTVIFGTFVRAILLIVLRNRVPLSVQYGRRPMRRPGHGDGEFNGEF